MRLLAVAVLVIACAACSNEPVQECPVLTGAGGGGDSLGTVGTAGQPVNAIFQVQLPVDCASGQSVHVTRIDLTVLDPTNHRVMASASAPVETLGAASTTITFTPAVAGTYHAAVRFEPNISTVQRDLMIADGP